MTNQPRIAAWVRKVFTEAEAQNAPERALRLVEEAIELAQACGVGRDALHRLVDYVLDRPVGDPAQEVAGTMVTLYALAQAINVDADDAFENEVSRIQQPEVIDRVRRRQHEKRAALVATPIMPDDIDTNILSEGIGFRRVPQHDPVVRPIEDLPGARPSGPPLERPKKTTYRPEF